MTLREFLDTAMAKLQPLYSGQEAKSLAVRLLKESLAGYKGYEHLVEPGTLLSDFSLNGALASSASAADFLSEAVMRLCAGEPLQYILGYEHFCGHRFNVAPGVLIPRPETEELVRNVAGVALGMDGGIVRVLDICTGSGCIAWSIAAELPQSQVYGCDISQGALSMAKGQELEGVEAEFFECDILSDAALEIIAKQCGEGLFDIIVSNPPYVCESEKLLMQKNVLDYEPSLALFVPDDDPLRFYRRIGELSGRLLKPGGKLFFEINERFGQQTLQMREEMGYEECKVMQDLLGKDRMTVATLRQM